MKRHHQNRGMALIAVLWLVAAMSILVMGATATVKQHLQVIGQVQDQASAQALGEAAIALALQNLLSQQDREQGAVTSTVSAWGQTMEVTLTPLNGWINLNAARPELLTKVFVHGAGMPSGAAESLAQAVVDWRDRQQEHDLEGLRNTGRGNFGFESVDDLMLVPGMTYDILSAVRPLLVADLPDAMQVSLAAAPPEVLNVLADGKTSLRDQVARSRGQSRPSDLAALMPELNAYPSTRSYYRAQAVVPLSAGKMLQLTQDVALSRLFSVEAPWSVLRSSWQVQTAAQ